MRLAGLLVDDRGQRGDLDAIQTAALALLVAPRRAPELFVLLIHTLDEILGLHRPVELVCIGQENRKHGERIRESETLRQSVVGEGRDQLHRVGFELLGQLARQLRGSLHVVHRHLDGSLQPQFQHTHHVDNAHTLLQNIVTSLEGLREIQTFGIDVVRPTVLNVEVDRIGHRIVRIRRPNEKAVTLADAIAVKRVVTPYRDSRDHGRNREQRNDYLFHPEIRYIPQIYYLRAKLQKRPRK